VIDKNFNAITLFIPIQFIDSDYYSLDSELINDFDCIHFELIDINSKIINYTLTKLN